MVYHIDWFAYIEESLHHWNKHNLIVVYEFFMYCWIMFAKIFLKIFGSVLLSDIGLYFSFMELSLSGFGIRMMVAS